MSRKSTPDKKQGSWWSCINTVSTLWSSCTLHIFCYIFFCTV